MEDNVNKKPFLNLFKTALPLLHPSDISEAVYDEKQQVSIEDGAPSWKARSRRRPTSCHTAGHRLKAGYTRSGKYKSSRYVKAKRDKRAGR